MIFYSLYEESRPCLKMGSSSHWFTPNSHHWTKTMRGFHSRFLPTLNIVRVLSLKMTSNISDITEILAPRGLRGSLSVKPATRVNKIITLSSFVLSLENPPHPPYPLRIVLRRGFRVVGFSPHVTPKGSSANISFRSSNRFRGHFLHRGGDDVAHKILNIFVVATDFAVKAHANLNLSKYVHSKEGESIVLQLEGELKGEIIFDLSMERDDEEEIDDDVQKDENRQGEANAVTDGVVEALTDDTVQVSPGVEKMRQQIVVALMAQDIEKEEHKQKGGAPLHGKWKNAVTKVANAPEKDETRSSRLQDYVLDLLTEVKHLRKERDLMRRAIAAMFSRLRLLTEDGAQLGGRDIASPLADSLKAFQAGGEFGDLDMEDIMQMEDALGESRAKVMDLERELEQTKRQSEQAQASRDMLQQILMDTESESYEVRQKFDELTAKQQEHEAHQAELESQLADSGGKHEEARKVLVQQIDDLRAKLKQQMKITYEAGISLKIDDFQAVMGDFADEVIDIDERRKEQDANKKKKAGNFNALMSYWNVKRTGAFGEDDGSEDEHIH
eukprot:TRINITY_DN272_c0_g1_i1.p2 TRINITY_DN272_c0_g1~~TRINITY_DN272_c0_g1_i1.p2  ORF type:complete len:557 (-),score=97.83 TRINITY_DN272_c0_g1_i1:358-2028(-)